jgi:hypothetical protein
VSQPLADFTEDIARCAEHGLHGAASTLSVISDRAEIFAVDFH